MGMIEKYAWHLLVPRGEKESGREEELISLNMLKDWAGGRRKI